MELNTKYKNREIDNIPKDWQLLTIGDVIRFEGGSQPPLFNFSHIQHKGYIRLIQIRDYKTDKYVVYIDEKLARKKCNSEDIMIGRYGPPIFQILKGLEGAYNVALIKVIPTEKLNKSYAYHFLKQDSLFSFIEKLSQRSGGQTGVDISELKKYPFPLPPTKAEQTAIATALNDADALITQLEKLIAKKRNIKQGAMQELLKPKEDWEVKKLGEIANVIMGQSPLSKSYNNIRIGLPLIQGNADIIKRVTIIRMYTSSITKKGKLGDIIMTVRAPVGEIAKAIFDCCIGRGVCAIRYENDYVFHYLIYFEKLWSKFSAGSTFDSVNSSQVRELEIPLPPVKTQTQIAQTLSDMDTEIAGLEKQLEKYKRIKVGMMQNLLTGKIRLV